MKKVLNKLHHILAPMFLWFFLSFVIVSAPGAPAAEPSNAAGVHSSFTGIPSNAESGISRPLILKHFSETLIRSFEISLQEFKNPTLAKWLGTVSSPDRLSGSTLHELFNEFSSHLLQVLSATELAGQEDTLWKAMQRSANFLRLDDRPLEENLPLLKIERSLEKSPPFTREIDNTSSTVVEVNWPGIDHYTEDRLGPLEVLINILNPADRVILTNTDLSEVLAGMTDLVSLVRYNLPISSYGKNITLATKSDGKKILVLSGFDSKAYLLHFGLIINRYRRIKKKQFSIFEFIDPKSLKNSYTQLLLFAQKHPSLFSSLDAIVIGYDSAFREQWKEYETAVACQRGFPGENWGINVFRFPEGKTAGVLTGDVDYYGEGLVCQIETLISRFPVKQVFFGGSGGAVIPRPIYDMYYPSVIRSSNVIRSSPGYETTNVLTGSSDAGTHVSVNSPLYETPLLLARFQAAHYNTVDMEAGHLARLAGKHGMEVGVGILVTDFPPGFESIDVTFAKQNFMAKQKARADFVRKVEAYVRRNEITYLHFLERLTGKTILEISRETLTSHRDKIGLFSPEEQEVVRRLFTLPFRIVVRMSPGRLHWTLKDSALFSTGLLNSLGKKTDPFTPELEDQMFGAFDYIFASYCTDFGQSMYGDVIVLLKPEEILPRSWGSRASGWRVAGYKKGSPLEVHQKNFLREVLHPSHYREAMELQAVYRYRRLKPSTRKMLMNRPVETWPSILYEIGFGKLELKIKSHVLTREIQRVILPPSVRGEIPGMLKQHNIPFEYYRTDDK